MVISDMHVIVGPVNFICGSFVLFDFCREFPPAFVYLFYDCA